MKITTIQTQQTLTNKTNSNSQENQFPPCSRCQKKSNPKWICSCQSCYYCSPNCKANDFGNHFKTCPLKGIDSPIIIRSDDSLFGQVGLENILNSCYINTTIQCLSCYWEFTNYFLTDKYRKHLNTDNPIGSHGLIAETFSTIIKQLIYGTNKIFYPLNFLLIFSKSQSFFPLGQQHDSQEFLMYLLDTLHEDLNKVKNKPVIENKNSFIEMKIDKVLSKYEWNKFLRRNQSLIVDLFYGQFKSEIMCPDIENCGFVSKKFDIFTCLSLPITKPEMYYFVKCILVFYDRNFSQISVPIPFIHNNNTIMVLRKKISKLINIHPMGFFILMHNKNKRTFQYQNITDNIIMSIEKDIKLDYDITYYAIQINPILFKEKVSNDYDTLGNTFMENLRNIENYTSLFKEDFEELRKGSNDINRKQTFSLKVGKNGSFYNYSYYYPSLYNMDLSTTEKYNKSFGMVCVDNYYGFNPNQYIHIPLYVKNHMTSQNNEDTLHFILTFNLSTSTVDVHKKIFEYLLPILHSFSSMDNISTVESSQIEKYFPHITEFTSINKPHSENMNFIIKRYPYIIYINKEMNNYLPYNKSISIGDVFKDFNKRNNFSTIDFENDNSFYFLSLEQRELINNRNNNFALYLYSNIKGSFLQKINNDVNTIKISEISSPKLTGKNSPKLYLEDLLFNFTKWEELDSTNTFLCEYCHKKQKAKKRIEIFKCPYYLIIQLKRFNNFEKDNSFVQFPLYNLDMSNFSYCDEESTLPLLYDLVSVINHKGSINNGHFFAFCKNIKTKEWFRFDDYKYKKITDEKDVIEDTAYVLFYRRKGLEKYFDMNEQYSKPLKIFHESYSKKTFIATSKLTDA